MGSIPGLRSCTKILHARGQGQKKKVECFVKHQIISVLSGPTSWTHTQMPSWLPITRSENQNIEQRILHGCGPTTRLPNLSERLQASYRPGTGRISLCQKLCPWRETGKKKGRNVVEYLGRQERREFCKAFLRVTPPRLLGGTVLTLSNFSLRTARYRSAE